MIFFVCIGYFCILGLEEFVFVGKIYGDVCFVGYYCNNGIYILVFCFLGIFFNFTGMGDINNCL